MKESRDGVALRSLLFWASLRQVDSKMIYVLTFLRKCKTYAKYGEAVWKSRKLKRMSKNLKKASPKASRRGLLRQSSKNARRDAFALFLFGQPLRLASTILESRPYFFSPLSASRCIIVLFGWRPLPAKISYPPHDWR